MRSILRTGTILTACVMFTTLGCSDDDDATPPADGSGAMDAAAEGEAGAVLADTQVASILNAVDQGEVLEAQEVWTRATLQAVEDYAAKMIQEHSLALQNRATMLASEQLIPEENPITIQLTQTVNQNVERLQALTGPALDRRYIEDQVTMHAAVLQIIDQQLAPSVRNAALASDVATARELVSQHWELATQILATLADAGVGDAGAEDGPSDADAGG